MRSASDRKTEGASARWLTRADWHFLIASGLVALFTAQRLTGYMSLFLYKRLAYEDLVILAHLLGGAGMVAMAGISASEAPMRLRDVPVIRVLAKEAWLVGSFLVVLLWWMCWPAWRPESAGGKLAGAAGFGVATILWLRPARSWFERRELGWGWRLGLFVVLWQAYSLDWELRLNFQKDDVTVFRGSPQWEQIAIDWVGSSVGVVWGWAINRTRRGAELP